MKVRELLEKSRKIPHHYLIEYKGMSIGTQDRNYVFERYGGFDVESYNFMITSDPDAKISLVFIMALKEES